MAEKLAAEVGRGGSVTAVDVSPEMLARARLRCGPASERSSGGGGGSDVPPMATVRFVESPAAPLGVDSETADAVYCQQGFQFFPDKPAAASEMHRVCKPGGRVAVSTWRPVDRCAYFGAIHDALKRCGEDEIAELITAPFNHMPTDELAGHFVSAGLEQVVVETPSDDMVFDRGVGEAYDTAFATPIGPRVCALPEATAAAFRDELCTALARMTADGVTRCAMASDLLVARKPA